MPPSKKETENDQAPGAGAGIFVANETFACEIDGERITVHKGLTRVREGHPLVETYPGYFEAADESVHYDIEQATAAPGEKRGDGK